MSSPHQGLVWFGRWQGKVLEPAVPGWMGTEEEGRGVRNLGSALPSVHFAGGVARPGPGVAQTAGGSWGQPYGSPRELHCCQLKMETM